MAGIVTNVTEGGLADSDQAVSSWPEPGSTGEAEESGVHEESERPIVAMTPRESGEQRRGCSQEGSVSSSCASDRRNRE